MKKIMLITLILLLFISCSAVYAENNVSSEILADDNSDTISSNFDGNIDLEISESDTLEKSAEIYDMDEFL